MDTLIWKRRFGKLYPGISKTPRKIILLYHAVGNGPQAMQTKLFSEQMAWLKRYCNVMPLSELLRTPAEPDVIQVAISFDDGYACLHDEVAPILEYFKMPAIVYLNTGWIDNVENQRRASDPSIGHYAGEQFLIWSEVSNLVRQGWDIGSHGVEHINLTQQNSQVINFQLAQSKDTIERRIQKPCLHFAYTWGKHSKPLRTLVNQAKYHYAVAAHHTAISERDNLFALPRMNIEKNYSMEDFIDIVMGKWDFMGFIHAVKYGLQVLS